MSIKISGDIIIKDGNTNLRSLKELNRQVTNNTDNIETLKRYVIYNNQNGTPSPLTLNDDIENYNYFEIESYCIFNNMRVYTTTGRIPIESKNRIHLNNGFVGVNGLIFICKRVEISEKNLSVLSDRYWNNGSYTDGDHTNITKIIGYK